MTNRRDQKYTGRDQADIDQLETEVQTPTTGLLDRMDSADNGGDLRDAASSGEPEVYADVWIEKVG